MEPQIDFSTLTTTDIRTSGFNLEEANLINKAFQESLSKEYKSDDIAVLTKHINAYLSESPNYECMDIKRAILNLQAMDQQIADTKLCNRLQAIMLG